MLCPVRAEDSWPRSTLRFSCRSWSFCSTLESLAVLEMASLLLVDLRRRLVEAVALKAAASSSRPDVVMKVDQSCRESATREDGEEQWSLGKSEERANTANASCGEVEHARQPVGTMRRLRTLCATGGSQSPLKRGVPERERALRACEQSSATLEFAGGIGEIRIR